MDVAAPLLLVDRPPCLPFVPVICTIEGVNWAGVHRGWHHNRPSTAPAHFSTALGLLPLRPCVLAPFETSIAVHPSEQPQQQRDQQQETQECQQGETASEISPGTTEIASVAD